MKRRGERESGADDASGADLAETIDLGEVRAAKRADPVRAAELRLRAAERLRRVREKREQRRFSAPARRRRRNWLIAAGAVVLLVVFVAAGVLTPLMAVQTIQVEGADTLEATEIEAALENLEGVPLALVEDGEVHRALEPFPLVQRYAIERVPPHTLVVRIEERVPVIALEEDEEFELFDPAGVLVGMGEERPVGVPEAADSVKNVSSEAFRSAADVLRDMPVELREQVVAVTATGGQDVGFTLESGVEVLWGEARQTQRKAMVLETMITALEGESVELIDVSSTEAPVFR